jgi:hypothetical protein
MILCKQDEEDVVDDDFFDSEDSSDEEDEEDVRSDPAYAMEPCRMPKRLLKYLCCVRPTKPYRFHFTEPSWWR